MSRFIVLLLYLPPVIWPLVLFGFGHMSKSHVYGLGNFRDIVWERGETLVLVFEHISTIYLKWILGNRFKHAMTLGDTLIIIQKPLYEIILDH